ncbi:hypothetical protein PAHA111176_09950 [Parendozoicomonas haliclonae]|uniref:Uncharacterized protein n=1 Tax=Parendozoicomonas haliclonae TaxID=1960125 RepID=A0A1X7ALP8_9GAMM|nr:hypothetical protein EHSB41UT_02959 [Parendozoicomonas haliclonae]
MQLTKREVELINKAERYIARTKVIRVMLFIFLVLSIILMLKGYLPYESLVYISLICVFGSIIRPDFNEVSYENIVKLLIRVRSDSDIQEEDPLVKSLIAKTNS